MDNLTVSIMAGALGLFLVAFTTNVVTWITQRTISKRKLIRAKLDKHKEF